LPRGSDVADLAELTVLQLPTDTNAWCLLGRERLDQAPVQQASHKHLLGRAPCLGNERCGNHGEVAALECRVNAGRSRFGRRHS